MKTKNKSHKILFVCYANMCRSPMAVAILKDIIVKDRNLNTLNIFVDSATMDNQHCSTPAAMSAAKAMKKRGLDITGHVSKPIDNLNLSEYDLILAMELNQEEDILAKFPKLEGHVFTVANYAGSPNYIDDPISTGKYSKCADQLEAYLIKIAERLADCDLNTASTDDIGAYCNADNSVVRSRWVEGIVSNWSEHIKIFFHKQDKDTTLIPVARIAPGRGRTTIVQFILNKDLPSSKTKRILKDVIREFNFFLSEKDEPDPWQYAMYHCTTASMLYSTVWWGYFPGPPVNRCFQSEIIKEGSIMSIDSFNDQIIALWRKYKREKELKYLPLIYSEPVLRKLLFISLNPSFDYKKSANREYYSIKNIDNDRREMMERHEKDMGSYDFFQPFKSISQYVYGDEKQWAQIDLFYYRETDEKKLKEVIFDNHKLNSFAFDQLKITKNIITYIDPKLIVVTNALARDVLNGERGELRRTLGFKVDKFDETYGIRYMAVDNKAYPTIFSALSVPTFDKGSREIVWWHIKRVVEELSLK